MGQDGRAEERIEERLRRKLDEQVRYVKDTVGIVKPGFQIGVQPDNGRWERIVSVGMGDCHTLYRVGYSPSEIGFMGTKELEAEIQRYLGEELRLKVLS